MRGKVLAPEHSDTIESMGNLAVQSGRMGRNAEAAELFRVVRDTSQRAVGPEDPATLASMDLGREIGCLRQTAEAVERYKAVLDIYRKRHQSAHPHALVCMAGLACELDNMGRHPEAVDYFKAVLDMRREVLGPEYRFV